MNDAEAANTAQDYLEKIEDAILETYPKAIKANKTNVKLGDLLCNHLDCGCLLVTEAMLGQNFEYFYIIGSVHSANASLVLQSVQNKLELALNFNFDNKKLDNLCKEAFTLQNAPSNTRSPLIWHSSYKKDITSILDGSRMNKLEYLIVHGYKTEEIMNFAGI